MSPRLRSLILLLAFPFLFFSLFRVYVGFREPFNYHKDSLSPYLMARAVLNSGNPYEPLPDLTARHLGAVEAYEWPHPTPHPPFMGLLAISFGLLEYRWAAIVWLIINFAFLAMFAALLRRFWPGMGGGEVRLVFLLTLGWWYTTEALIEGNVSITILLLLVAAWLDLREGREARGGLLLGLSLAIKPTLWPVAVFLALCRRWRATACCAMIVIMAHIIAAAWLGFDLVADYYLKVGPQVTAYYRMHDHNLAPWTWGPRIFAVFGRYYHTIPLFQSKVLASVVSLGSVGVIILGGLVSALRVKSFDIAIALLAIVSILASPVVWAHYFVIALTPLAILARNLYLMKWPRGLTTLAIASAILLSLPGFVLGPVAKTFARTDGDILLVPWWAGLLMLAPVAGLGGLLWALISNGSPVKRATH